MILRDTLLRRNVAEYSALLLVIASHVYKDDAWASCVTPESAFFRILLRAEVAARRIEVARRQVEQIRALVDIGAEARIRLDAAERDLEDTKDKVILETAVPPVLSDENGPSDDAIVGAAQRRLDRQTA
jgi:hypothetical protein